MVSTVFTAVRERSVSIQMTYIHKETHTIRKDGKNHQEHSQDRTQAGAPQGRKNITKLTKPSLADTNLTREQCRLEQDGIKELRLQSTFQTVHAENASYTKTSVLRPFACLGALLLGWSSLVFKSHVCDFFVGFPLVLPY